MIGHVPTAVRAMKLDTSSFEQLRLREQVFVMAVAAHGDDVRMLDHQQLVGDLAALALLDQVLLLCERFGVAHAVQIAQLADSRGCHNFRH